MATGKWREPGVPHKGWVCLSVEDLEDARDICEMCEVVEIRFVHFMQHPEYPETLRCGCICAGHMEQDLEAAQGRERQALRLARRRARFPRLRGWGPAYRDAQRQLLNSNNEYLVEVYPQNGVWRFSVMPYATRRVVHARKDYPTQDAAKLTAFDAIQWLKARGR